MRQIFLLNPSEAINHAPAALKTTLRDFLSDFPDRGLFLADKNWSRGKTSIWHIKVSKKNFEHVGKKTKKTYRTKKEIDVLIEDYPIRFIKFRDPKEVSDTERTAMQEQGSAWIMRRAIRDNRLYSSWKDIKTDRLYPELEKIYPYVDDDPTWIKTYYAQQERMLKEFANASFTEYEQNGEFMQFISEYVKRYGVSKKDNWNPADIWLVRHRTRVINRIKKATSGRKSTQTIYELNDVMRSLFQSRDLVGISLKKVSGKVARYEEINVDPAWLPRDFTYDTHDIRLSIDMDSSKTRFLSKDTRVIVKGDGVTFNFQIKADQKGFSNLKFEPSKMGATGGRMGKPAADRVRDLLKDYGLAFKNDHNQYAKDFDSFSLVADEYAEKIMILRKHGINVGVNSKKHAKENLAAAFLSKDVPTAQSTLMQIDFIYDLVHMNEEKRDEFMTDMVYLAEKRGKEFGPFGKIFAWIPFIFISFLLFASADRMATYSQDSIGPVCCEYTSLDI